MGLRAMRRRHQEDSLFVVMQAAEFHNLLPADQRRNSEPVGDAFTEGRQMRLNAVTALRSAQVPAKSRDHFIENEYCPCLLAKPLHAREEVIFGLDRCCGLQYNACNLAGIPIKKSLQTIDVVVSELNGEVLDHPRNAR